MMCIKSCIPFSNPLIRRRLCASCNYYNINVMRWGERFHLRRHFVNCLMTEIKNKKNEKFKPKFNENFKTSSSCNFSCFNLVLSSIVSTALVYGGYSLFANGDGDFQKPSAIVIDTSQNPNLIIEGRRKTSIILKRCNETSLANSNKDHSIFQLPCLVKNLLSNYFVVNAAKPLPNDNNDEEGNNNKPKKPLSPRKQYNFIADAVESVVPGVVSIEVKDHGRIDFFTGVPQTVSNGSGFIVDGINGIVLTNAHVVASRPRSSVSVRLWDGRIFAGKVEEVDQESDLATIKITSGRNLPSVPLGCSSQTRIGEFVVAVGAPLYLANSVTTGVVSNVNRGASELGIRSNDINYIQTDAAITFGNSGGPLINLDGEVIGINSMKITAGISFAIPIDHAKEFLSRAEKRRTSGSSKRTTKYIGVNILTLTDQIRRELQARGGYHYTNVANGVLVWQVVLGSPAYLAGILPGDIIIRINNRPIHSSMDLLEMVSSSAKLQIQVLREGKVYACTVTPEDVREDD